MSKFRRIFGRVLWGAWLLAGVMIWAYLAVAIGAYNAPILVRMYMMIGLFIGVFLTSVEPVVRFFDPNWPKGYYED